MVKEMEVNMTKEENEAYYQQHLNTVGKKTEAQSLFTQFNEVELNLLSTACLSAAFMSRQAGHNNQATEFHWLSDKCEMMLCAMKS